MAKSDWRSKIPEYDLVGIDFGIDEDYNYRNYNLLEIQNRFAKQIRDSVDSMAFTYIHEVIEFLKYQGKNIEDYAIISVDGPMEYKNSGVVIRNQWRIVPISDLNNLPTFDDQMGRQFLKDGRVLDLTEEQSIYLAQLVFFIPDYKTIKMNDQVFTLADIDHEAYKKSLLPQQTGMELGVEAVDNREFKTNQ